MTALYNDGSATFAGDCLVGTSGISSPNTETTATYFAQNTAGGRLWSSDGAETSTIWADGSASFASTVTCGSMDYTSAYSYIAYRNCFKR